MQNKDCVTYLRKTNLSPIFQLAIQGNLENKLAFPNILKRVTHAKAWVNEKESITRGQNKNNKQYHSIKNYRKDLRFKLGNCE